MLSDFCEICDVKSYLNEFGDFCNLFFFLSLHSSLYCGSLKINLSIIKYIFRDEMGIFYFLADIDSFSIGKRKQNKESFSVMDREFLFLFLISQKSFSTRKIRIFIYGNKKISIWRHNKKYFSTSKCLCRHNNSQDSFPLGIWRVCQYNLFSIRHSESTSSFVGFYFIFFIFWIF